jgi:UDP-N-acetylmuramate-alanine ligase
LREIGQALEEFTGLSRDFESRGSYRGVTLVDDEGWEASSVGETLMVARQVFGRRRIWAVHGTEEGSVGSCDAEQYVPAFVPADQVLIADGRGDSSPLLRALLLGGVRARSVAGLDHAIVELDRCLEPGDVLVTLGNGDVGTIADAFIRRLPRNRPGQ